MPPKKDLRASNGSIVIGGNVQGSNIVMGNNNTVTNQTVNVTPLFEAIYQSVETHPSLKLGEKADVKADLQDVKNALEEPKPDENFLARRFRNIKRMAPDIVEVAFETLKNPLGGVVEVMKRVAKKMAEDENA
jgi:hypothetical protein